MTHRKPAAVSMDPLLHERARQRAHDLGFPTFSAYVCQLIRSDISTGGGISIVQEHPTSSGVTLPARGEVSYQPARKRAPKKAPEDKRCALSNNCPEACPILDRFDVRNPK